MRLHHLGWVVKDIGRSLCQLEREGAHAVTAAIADPIQRVTVQFLSDPHSPVLWELIAPTDRSEDSPCLHVSRAAVVWIMPVLSCKNPMGRWIAWWRRKLSEAALCCARPRSRPHSTAG